MKWTEAQDEYLIEHSHEGVESVRKGMFDRFGVIRSAAAITSHGTRIGASWERFSICPVCGDVTRRLARGKGMCQACAWEAKANEKAELREKIKRSERRLEKAKASYFREYRRNARSGIFAQMPTKMPNRSSEVEKSA